MLTAVKGINNLLRWRAPKRPDAGPTVEVLNGSGGSEVVVGTATIALEAATTLTGAHAAGVTTLTVAATTGWAVGDEVAVGLLYRPTDFQKIATVDSATVVTLQFPTVHAYTAGVAVGRTYVLYTLLAAVADAAEKDWVARFSWKFGTADQPPGILRFDIVDYGVGNMPATISDARLLEPKLTQNVSSDYDWERAFQEALNDVLRDLNATDSAEGLLTDDDWRELVALRVVANASRTYGDVREKGRMMWEEKYQIRYMHWKAQFSIDKDQDRIPEVTERSPYGGSLRRG